MKKQHLALSIRKSTRAIIDALPIITGMLLLSSLIVQLFPAEIATEWFGQSQLVDVLIGTTAGSLATGSPLASYTLGGELLANGVSLLAVTALIVSWVTVGIVQLPAEMLILGKRFAIYRNISCFIFVIAVSFSTYYTLQLFK